MKFTETQLTKLTKKDVVGMCLSLQQLVESLTTQCEKQEEQLKEMNQKMDLLIEQMGIAQQKRYGRSKEKIDWEGQLAMLFNEAEVLIVDKYVVEPTLSQVCPDLEDTPAKKCTLRPKGKSEADLAGVEVKIINHTLSGVELSEKFGDTWRRLPDEVYKCLAFHPETFEVEEHHIAVYTADLMEKKPL